MRSWLAKELEGFRKATLDSCERERRRVLQHTDKMCVQAQQAVDVQRTIEKMKHELTQPRELVAKKVCCVVPL